MMAEFSRKYPRVKFDVYTANADQIKHRIDNGLTDIGLLLEPVDMERYEYIVYERLSPSINRLFSVLWYQPHTAEFCNTRYTFFFAQLLNPPLGNAPLFCRFWGRDIFKHFATLPQKFLCHYYIRSDE